jgi:peptidoglycan hydrolase CwlO-like protein
MKRLLSILPVLLLAGCAHPAPRAIVLPTTAAVRAPIIAAQTSTARAVQIVAKADKTGLAAGSADLHELTAALADVTVQLATAKSAVDSLTAQLLAAQTKVDSQTTRLDELTTKLNTAEETIRWYRLRFWGPICMVILSGILFLVIRFTSWGARTFGSYVLGAEHLAAKAAVLV